MNRIRFLDVLKRRKRKHQYVYNKELVSYPSRTSNRTVTVGQYRCVGCGNHTELPAWVLRRVVANHLAICPYDKSPHITLWEWLTGKVDCMTPHEYRSPEAMGKARVSGSVEQQKGMGMEVHVER